LLDINWVWGLRERREKCCLIRKGELGQMTA
jgi:hypothetical protein